MDIYYESIDLINSIETSIYYINALPNPTSQNVIFVFSKNLNEKATLTISTIDGRTMMIKENISSNESVDVSILPSGIYICTINTISGSRIVKVVKK